MNSAHQQNSYPCDHIVPIEQEPRHHLVFENEFVRSFVVEVAPRERTLCHHHPHDYLLYVADGGEIISAAREEEPKRLSYRPGECELAPGGLIHVVENLSDAAFRNVVVELLPRVKELRRGKPPKGVAGDVAISEILSDTRAAVFSIDVTGGAEVEIAGAAVVASLYEPPDRSGQPDATNDKFNRICTLDWLAARRQMHCHCGIRGSQPDLRRIIVFQVGAAG